MKVITTNRLNRFWKNGILPKIAEKLAKSNVINNLTTTAAGYALDARQGKALKDEIDKTNTSLSTLNSDLSDTKDKSLGLYICDTQSKPYINIIIAAKKVGYYPLLMSIGSCIYAMNISASVITGTLTPNNGVTINQLLGHELIKGVSTARENDTEIRLKLGLGTSDANMPVTIIPLRKGYDVISHRNADS